MSGMKLPPKLSRDRFKRPAVGALLRSLGQAQASFSKALGILAPLRILLADPGHAWDILRLVQRDPCFGPRINGWADGDWLVLSVDGFPVEFVWSRLDPENREEGFDIALARSCLWPIRKAIAEVAGTDDDR